MDGTEPTKESTLYSTHVSVQTAEASKTVKAVAVKEGMLDSDVMSVTYTNSAVSTMSEEGTEEKGTARKKASKKE